MINFYMPIDAREAQAIVIRDQLAAASEEAPPESTGPAKVVAVVPTGSPAVCANCEWSNNPWSNYPRKVLCMVGGWGTGTHKELTHTCGHYEPRQENNQVTDAKRSV